MEIGYRSSIPFSHSKRNGLWIMDYGLWIMDYGLWIMDYGLWIMDYNL